MRLLLVTPEYPPHAGGGIVKYYSLMARAWTEAGAGVSVLVATPFSSFDDYEDRGVRVRFVPLARVNHHAERLIHLAAAPTFRRYIAAGLAAADWIRSSADTFDAIETTDFGLLFAPLASMDGRPPLVVKMHGSLGQISEHEPPAPTIELDGALARLTEAVVMPCVDALHAYSPANAAEWSGRLGRPVAFLPAALPLPDLPAARQENDFAGVVVGRIQAWKGPELVCRAFEALGSRAPWLRIAWIGRDTASGPDGQSMSAHLASRYPRIWGDRIVPIGPRTAAEVERLQGSAPFVLVPSTWDTFNFTLAEAMGLGCVAIASSGAGASYLVEHGRNGLRFQPEDHRALAELLIEASAMSGATRRELGAAARETIARDLDPAAAAAASLTALAALPSADRPHPPKDWVREFFEPDTVRTVGTGYLENVSIRALASHLKTRVARKIVG